MMKLNVRRSATAHLVERRPSSVAGISIGSVNRTGRAIPLRRHRNIRKNILTTTEASYASSGYGPVGGDAR